MNKIKIFWQYLLPQHFLSQFAGKLATCRQPRIKNFLIKIFCFFYRVDLNEAEFIDYRSYENFQQFFTRRLKSGVRTFAPDTNVIISPVDGKISHIGAISNGQMLQAKNFYFTLEDLLGGRCDLASLWQDGTFATIYLAPHNYHRVHMPFLGALKEMIYVPGKLFAVNRITAASMSNLFARNERVICVFETNFGPMAVILVGALIVGSISTAWDGTITPPHGKTIMSRTYADKNITLNRGDELGAFNLGSTVIVLLPKDKIAWAENCVSGVAIKMGELLGEVQL